MTEIFDDINKIYQFRKPVEPLAPFIEFFSESSGTQTAATIGAQPFTVKLFPSFTPTIWINLGAPYAVHMNGQKLHIRKNNHVLLLRNIIVTRHNLPADHIFTIKFYPGGLEAILGIHQPLLSNKVVNATFVMPGNLIDRLEKKQPFERRVYLLETFLLQQLKNQNNRDHYTKLVAESIGLYDTHYTSCNTTQLAEKMFVTSRTMNRYFHKTIGTSPKQYFSIVRARKALASYKIDRHHFDPTIHGFYDMSHFYKATSNFTGQRISPRH